jgi:hypothetical protein
MIFKADWLSIDLSDSLLQVLEVLYRASSFETQEYYSGLYGFRQENLITVEGLLTLRHGSFTRYHRDTAALAVSSNGLYSENKRYLGDWHSHPNDLSTPTEADLGILRGNFFDGALLIVTGKEGHTIYAKDGNNLIRAV